MNISKVMINAATLKMEVKKLKSVTGIGVPTKDVEGYMLKVDINGEIKTLSTYRSDVPRHFKRSDALLNEAKKLGLLSITFDLRTK